MNPTGTTPVIRNIALMVAMEEEAADIINLFEMQPVEIQTLGIPKKSGLQVYRRIYTDKNTKEIRKIHLVQHGKSPDHKNANNVSTIPAAIATAYAIDYLAPDLILSVGTAGALGQARVGDIFVANTEINFCDRVIDTSNRHYKEYAEGHYPVFRIDQVVARSAKKLTNIFKEKLNGQEFPLKLGCISTGSSLNLAERDIKKLNELNADMNEMEFAAVGFVAVQRGILFNGAKVATNYLDPNLHTDFINNLPKASLLLAQTLKVMIPEIFEQYAPSKAIPKAKL